MLQINRPYVCVCVCVCVCARARVCARVRTRWAYLIRLGVRREVISFLSSRRHAERPSQMGRYLTDMMCDVVHVSLGTRQGPT